MIAKTEKIGIPGRAVSLLLQKTEELRPFEDESIRVVTPGEAREKTAQGKLLEQGGVVNSCLAPLVLEPILE